jgi:hypothetical protein
VPHEKLVFAFLLLEGVNGARRDTMGLLAPAADKRVSGKLGHRQYPHVFRLAVIKITALDHALLALARGADIEIDKEPFVLALFRLDVHLALVYLFRARIHIIPSSLGSKLHISQNFKIWIY